jgi:GcrA cell cycle regulator
MLATIWDDPKNVDLLKKMWIEGASASEIALAIGQGATRAAVIGKVHRLKIAKRSTVAIDTQRRESSNPSKKPHRNQGQVTAKGIVSRVAARAQHRQRQTTAAKVQNRDNTPFRAGSLPPERDEGVDVGHLLGIMDLDQGAVLTQCRWPIGDPLEPGFGFCGERCEDGKSYCSVHQRRAYSGRAAQV